MDKYIRYTHGETGIALLILADISDDGNVDIKKVLHKGEDILPLLGEDIIVDIELFVEDFISVTIAQ